MKTFPQLSCIGLLCIAACASADVRGALRIAKAAESLPLERYSQVAQASPSAVASGVWTSHQLRLACAECNFEIAMRDLLEALGATGITARPRHWSFQSLSAAEGAGKGASQSPVAAHWRTVVIGREGRWQHDKGADVVSVLYDNLRTDILPLFTIRNLSERDGRITVDVLVAGAEPAGGEVSGKECHRVARGNQIERYCGNSAARNHPLNQGVQPTVSAPVNPPPSPATP